MRVTSAIPKSLVNTAPEAGENEIRSVLVVLNVTFVLATGLPSLSITVACAVLVFPGGNRELCAPLLNSLMVTFLTTAVLPMIWKSIDEVTVSPSTLALTDSEPAPVAAVLARFTVISATPLAFVTTEVDGEKVTRSAALAVAVTKRFGTGAPVLSTTVALSTVLPFWLIRLVGTFPSNNPSDMFLPLADPT